MTPHLTSSTHPWQYPTWLVMLRSYSSADPHNYVVVRHKLLLAHPQKAGLHTVLTAMPLLQTGGAFRSVEHETAFRQEQQALTRRQDQLIGHLSFALWCLVTFRYQAYFPTAASAFLQASAGALVLVPWLCCCLLGPEAYTRHRHFIIAAVRLAVLLMPSFSDVVVARHAPPVSAREWLGSLLMVLRLPKLLSSAFGFRLPFFTHCAVHAVVVAQSLRTLPHLCSLPFFQDPLSVECFSSTAQYLVQAGGWFTLFFAAPVGPGSTSTQQAEQAGQQIGEQAAHCGCTRVLGALMVLVGYVLPTFVASLFERSARANFVSSRVHEGGWEQEELREHLLFDYLPPTLLFSFFVPAIVGIVWQASLPHAKRLGTC